MSIELAATEDVTKTLCEREREPGTGKHKHERESNPVFNKYLCRKYVLYHKNTLRINDISNTVQILFLIMSCRP